MGNPFRQLARDSVVYGLSTVVQRLLTFLLTPLYTNVLTPAELGDVAQLYSLMALASVLATSGFEQAFMRYWVEDDKRRGVITHAVGGVATVAVLIAGIGAAAAPVIASSLVLSSTRGAALVRLAFAIVALDAVATIPLAMLRMERRAMLFASLRVLSVVVNVAFNILLVSLWQWGVDGVMIAGLVSSLVASLLATPLVLPHIGGSFDRTMLGILLRFGLPTVPASLAAMIVQVADRPILGWLAGGTSVGIYNANYRLAIPMMLAVSVFETAWRPLYLQHASDSDIGTLLARAMRYFIAGATALFTIVTLFIGDVVAIPIGSGHLIGAQYWSGLGVVPIVMAGYIALGLITTMVASILITKRTTLLPLIYGIAALTNVVLNVLLIPLLGYIGAAWATFGAYAVGAVATSFLSRRVLAVPYPWWSIVQAAGICIAVGIVNTLFPQQGMLWVKAVAALAACGGAYWIGRFNATR
ncbi:MAG: oligosaccharide flippase family protein [Chlorobi bacterium]|nr:oligosaccharide flippase family protein [Chlorobiota bacterium]